MGRSLSNVGGPAWPIQHGIISRRLEGMRCSTRSAVSV